MYISWCPDVIQCDVTDHFIFPGNSRRHWTSFRAKWYISTAEVFYRENIEAMWTCSFKIIMQIEIKEHLSVRLTSQTTEFTAFVAGYVFFLSEVRFISALLKPSKPYFSLGSLPWNVRKTEANPQLIGSLSAYGTNPPNIDRPLIPSQWNLYANLPFFHPATKIMQNVQTSKNKKRKKIQKRKISSPHERIFAAGHRISFFPPGLNLLTHWVSRRFARLLCRPHVLQMRCQ